MMTNKIFTALLAFVLALALAGCGESVSTSANDGENTTTAGNAAQSASANENDSSEKGADATSASGDGIVDLDKWHLIYEGGTEEQPMLEYEYDANWCQTRFFSRSYKDGEISTESISIIDPMNKKIAKHLSYSGGKLVYEEDYKYDAQNRRILSTRKDSDGEWVKETREYNPDGSYTETRFSSDGEVTSISEYDSLGRSTRTTWSENGQVELYENEYDVDGNITRITTYRNGAMSRIVQYEYNEDGEVLFWYDYTPDSGEWTISQERVYEEHGLQICRISYGSRETNFYFREYKNGRGEVVNGYAMDIEPYRATPHLPE